MRCTEKIHERKASKKMQRSCGIKSVLMSSQYYVNALATFSISLNYDFSSMIVTWKIKSNNVRVHSMFFLLGK